MKTNRISVIMLVAFSVSILLMFDYVVKPAYAVDTVDVTLNDAVAVSYHSISGLGEVFTAIDESTGAWKTIVAQTGAVQYSGSIDSVCELGGTRTCTYKAIDCNGSTCYIMADSTVSDSITQLTVTSGSASLKYNYSSVSAYNVVKYYNGALYVSYSNAGADVLNKLNISFTPYNITASFADLGVDTVSRLYATSIGGVNYMSISASAAGNWFKIFTLDTFTVKCTASGTVTSRGIIYDATTGVWLITNTGGDVKTYNNNCVSVSSIASTNFCGSTGSTQSVKYSGNSVFVACVETGSANNAVVVYNTSSSSIIAKYFCGSSVAWSASQEVLAYAPSSDSIACTTYTHDTVRITFQSGFNQENNAPTDACIENPETLLCRLQALEGNALGSATESTTTSLNDLFVQSGLVAEGSDIQTNGVGYFIIAVMLGIMIAMFALASNMELGKIPPFVWMLGAISVVGSGTAFGLVDTTFFIISILIIIALASMKILSAFERF